MNIKELQKALSEINEKQLGLFKRYIDLYRNIIILGNGGSSAVSSHISQDYSKVLSKKCFTFSDSSRLTCYINDYGMENAYKEFLEDFVDGNDGLVILISSSGNSQNIVNCIKYCEENFIDYITLTGFSSENKVRMENKNNCYCLLDIWVDSKDYGVVELAHEAFLHSVC